MCNKTSYQRIKGLISIRGIFTIFSISFILGFIYQNYLEFSHKSDSIGIIYTLYGATIYAIMISIGPVIVYCVYKFMLKKKKRN